MPRGRKKIAGQNLVEPRSSHAGDEEGARFDLHPTEPVPRADQPRMNPARSVPAVRRGPVDYGHQAVVAPSPSPLIAELIEWQRRRVHAIRAQSQCDRSCDAYVSRYLGYHSGLPQAERLALMKQAAKMREEIEKSRGQRHREALLPAAPDAAGGEGQMAREAHDAAALAACLPIIVNTIQSRAGWDALRTDAERRMREIARTLPVYERCAAVPGFGDLGLACIVAEAGNDLTAYPHYYHLWKRLGLAPFKGKAMSTFRGNELTKAEWSSLGYSPMRRGRMAGDVGAALFFTKARNAYGAVYAERRERTALDASRLDAGAQRCRRAADHAEGAGG